MIQRMEIWQRRIIPLIVSLVVGGLSIAPLWGGWPGDERANEWAQSILVLISLFLAALFYEMRRRMKYGRGVSLTIFGQALRDLFLAVMMFFLATASLFAWFLSFTYRDSLPGFWEIASLRSLLAGSGTLALGTGIAVAYEMNRSRPSLAVHALPESEKLPSDIVTDRRSGIDRRKGPQPPIRGDS